MRGRNLSAPLKAKFAIAEIIRDDKHDVRFLGTNREHGGREARHQSEHLNHDLGIRVKGTSISFIDPEFLHKLVIDISENGRAFLINLECGTLRSRNLFSIVGHVAIANFEVMTIVCLGKCYIAIENFRVLYERTIDDVSMNP